MQDFMFILYARFDVDVVLLFPFSQFAFLEMLLVTGGILKCFR